MMILFLLAISLQRVTAPVATNQELLQQIIEILEKRDEEILIQRAYSEPFSPELFYEALRIYVKYPDIVYRQAVLETGWFKSNVFKDLNNMFGMHYPKDRETTATGWRWGDPYNGRHYRLSRYNNWIDCVKDFAMWQNYWESQGKSLHDYYKFLEELPYATAKNYIKTLKIIENPHV